MKKCVYAGSFDPITNGHLSMVKETAGLFDELIVAIGVNPGKKPTFSLDAKLDMLEKVLKPYSNVKIDHYEDQYLIHYAESKGAQYILRGIRSVKDYEYEKDMRDFNRKRNSKIETLYLIPDPERSSTSSSMVKGLVGPENWEDAVKPYLPSYVYNKFLRKFKGNLRRWNKLSEKLNLNNSEDIYENLSMLYSDRMYHNLVHLTHCLKEFDDVKMFAVDPDALEMALWFHDCVYNIYEKDNEKQSAKHAGRKLRRLDDGFIKKVKDLIMVTEYKTMPKDVDKKLISDIDLAILGQPEDVYDEYEFNIIQEYSGIIAEMGLEKFNKRRKTILNKFLRRKNIYLTEHFRTKYEYHARNNLKRSIKKL